MTLPADRPSQPSIYPILSVNFVGTLGFSIVLPFLVFLVTRLGGNALIYGIMGATYSFFQLIGAPILGRWSDRFGRKRILLLSQLGTLASWCIFLVALLLPTTPLMAVDSEMMGAFTVTVPLAVLFVARALDGITGGNVSVANAYLADISDDTNRSANYGKMAVSSNLGFILGPALAGVLGATALGEILPVAAALLISAVATLLIAMLLQETRCGTVTANPAQGTVREIMGQEQKECFELASSSAVRWREILRMPTVPVLLGIHFAVFLAFNFFYVAFPLYAVTGLEWSLVETGIFFSVLGLSMAVVQGPVLGYASRRWSERHLLVAGSLMLGLSFFFFTSERVPFLYVGTGLLALGNGIMWPSLLALLARAAGNRVQGAVQGFAGSSAAVASIVGLLVGGVLFGWIGAAVFMVSAVITLVVFLVSLGLTGTGVAALARAAAPT